MFPENPLQQLQSLPNETAMMKGDVARWLEVAKPYEFIKFLPATVKEGVNFPTAIAIIQAIDQKGQTQGWNQKDIQLILPATQIALKTAGLANSRTGLEALLTGSTGNLESIMETIVPEKSSKAVQLAAKAMIGFNQIDNIGQVISLLVDERKIEKRLLRLTKLQRAILLDPAKTRALLDLLNTGVQDQPNPLSTNLPQTAEMALIKISPFSLQDMTIVNGLFNAVEAYTDSRLTIDRNTLWFKTEGERLLAAAQQLGQISGDAAAATTEAILTPTGKLIGGAIGGTIKGGDEMIWKIREAIEIIKERNKTRRLTEAV